MGIDPGDSAAGAMVPALLRARVPDRIDPETLEAVLAQAVNTGLRPVTAEVAWIPPLSTRVRGELRLVTCALVLQCGPGASRPDAVDDLVARANEVATAAVRRRFGPEADTAAKPARTASELAACRRAMVGMPFSRVHHW